MSAKKHVASFTAAAANAALRAPSRLPIVPRMHASGFTLLESLVALATVGTLAAVAGPSLSAALHGMQLQAVSADLLHPLMAARSQALKGQGYVTVCASADGAACARAARWEQGWIVFQDRNHSGTREPEEPLLQQVPAAPAGWRIHANAPLGRYVSYGPMGASQLASGAFQAGTFTVCRASTERREARQIVVNAAGRPRVQKAWPDSCP